jgi:hypothetical protein
MEKIKEFAGRKLEWAKPKLFRPYYELIANNLVIAELSFKNNFSSQAAGRSADGSWSMKRTGFWGRRVIIKDLNSDITVAEFTGRTWRNGGEITLSGGSQYVLKASFWKMFFEIQTSDGIQILSYSSPRMFKRSAFVEIDYEASNIPDLPWLVILGCYLGVMQRKDAASAAAAAS